MELLGSEFSIESLSKDVADIHTVLGNLTSRLGQVDYTSWKYPDKLAMDVDIPELLEQCEYDAECQEDNKISHLLLLEAVVDRLLFFVQCSSRFMDQQVPSTRAQSVADKRSSSIGVVTKKYWTKLLQVYSNIQQVYSDKKSHQKKVQELQSYNQELLDELANYHQGVTQVPACSTQGRRFSNSSVLPPITPSSVESGIAKDNSNKSSQTLETAFVPCESCHKVQDNYKTVADSMSNLCKTQGLPSAIAKYRKQLQSLDWYSANDLSRWSVEQSKDLERINKHLSDLMSTIDPLKEELADTITSCRKLEQRVKECQREIQLEKETQKVLELQHTNKVEKLAKDHKEVKDELERQCSQLEVSKQQLNNKLRDTTCDLELQMSKYKELDDVKKQLLLELEDSRTNNSEVKRLESILSSLEQEMSHTTSQLTETKAQLEQEQAITKSLTKRTESLQSKYDSLVRRIDVMDDDNNTLQSELSALVEEKEQLEISLAESLNQKQSKTVVEKIEVEKVELRSHMKSLQQTVSTLEEDLQSMKEREKLLVEYPDLNGPVNADMTGTGDIATDMLNQVEANELRITLLNKQNSTMRKTLNKLSGHHQPQSRLVERENDSRPQYNSVPPMEPTVLWKQSESMTYGSGDANGQFKDSRPNSAVTKTKSRISQNAGDNPKRNREKQSTLEAQSNAGVDAYIKLRKAGLLKPGGNDAGKGGRDGQSSGESGSFCCPNCDKLYHTLSDLDIHKSYCAQR